jgi:hypothetical protein
MEKQKLKYSKSEKEKAAEKRKVKNAMREFDY